MNATNVIDLTLYVDESRDIISCVGILILGNCMTINLPFQSMWTRRIVSQVINCSGN